MFRIFILLFLSPIFINANILILDSNNRLKNFEWNGETPIALDIEFSEQLSLSACINKKVIPLTKTLSTNFEESYYIYTPPAPIKETLPYKIIVENSKRLWPFRSYTIKVTPNTTKPQLEQIAITSEITHGGAGIVVIQSEQIDKLSFLGLIDEKGVVFYPQKFYKNGFYTILFSWYTDYSKNLGNQYILAIDKAGNMSKLPIASKAKLRAYKESRINLPDDYAQQKAKELKLSKEESKKLEGNINQINSALQVKSVSRWALTRTSFKNSIYKTVTQTNIFSEPKAPMLNDAINTGTYGDQRKYYYKNKIVRTSVHRGLDFASWKKNIPIYALLDGQVVYSDWNGGLGKTIFIDHGMGVFTMYSHNRDLIVKEGAKVKAGQQIAISGTTGQSTGDHLHLSVIIQGMYVEPKEWLTAKNINNLFHKPLEQAKKHIDSLKAKDKEKEKSKEEQ